MATGCGIVLRTIYLLTVFGSAAGSVAAQTPTVDAELAGAIHPEVNTTTLANGQNLLLLQDKEAHVNITDACHDFLAKPFIASDEETLILFVSHLSATESLHDAGYWVGINGSVPARLSTGCATNPKFPDSAVCFGNFNTFEEMYPGTLDRPPHTLAYALQELAVFRPVCEKGLSCLWNQDGPCWSWLVNCKLYGSCEDRLDEISLARSSTCEYPPPLPRIINTGVTKEVVNITCGMPDQCLKDSYGSVKMSFIFYKDGQFLAQIDDFNAYSVPKEDADSTFQCEYKLGEVYSKPSYVISRPQVEPDKWAVRKGGRVEFTCIDPGTRHLEDELVKFKWMLPNGEKEDSANNTYIHEDFSDNDFGPYKCRSIVGNKLSIWSNPVRVTRNYDDPVLTATQEAESSSVILKCITRDSDSFSYTFYKEGEIEYVTNSSEYRIDELNALTEGDYRCSIGVANREVASSDILTLMVEPTQETTLGTTLETTLETTLKTTQETKVETILEPTRKPTLDSIIDTNQTLTLEQTLKPTLGPTPGTALETSLDPTLETSLDPTLETSLDQTLETSLDQTLETSLDQTLETSLDQTLETSLDQTLETSLDQTLETSLDQTLETGLDPTLETSLDPTLETSLDQTLETSLDQTLETSLDQTLETGLDPTLETSLDPTLETSLDPTLETDLDPTLETSLDPTLETGLDSALETDLDSALETDQDSALETDLDSALETDLDSAVETDLDSTPEAALDPTLETPVLVSDVASNVLEGQPVTLTCLVTTEYQGESEMSLTFHISAGDSTREVVRGENSDVIISNFSADDQGIYDCYFTLLEEGSPGNVPRRSNSSNSITLRLVTAVLVSTATTVPQGSDIHLLCNVNNYNGTVERYSWFKGGLNTIVHTSTTSDTQIIKNFQSKHDGVYRCQAILSDPQLAGPPLTSLPLSLVSVPRYRQCRCVCSNKALSLTPVTTAVIEEATQAIQKNLSINKANLSSHIRRLICAPDERPGSVSTGSIAVVLLALVAGMIIIPDLIYAALALLQRCTGKSGKEVCPAEEKFTVEMYARVQQGACH